MFIESYTQPDIWCLVMKFLIGVVSSIYSTSY